MLARTWSAPLILWLSSCGPEAGVVPRTGIYDVTSATVTSGCGPNFLDMQTLDAVVFADDRLTLGFPDVPSMITGTWIGSRVYTGLVRGPGDQEFVTEPDNFFDTWFEVRDCRQRRGLTAEVLAADVIRARVYFEWADAGACTWLDAGPTGCKVEFEHTYTLREACEDCTLHDLFAKIWALVAMHGVDPADGG